MISTIRSERGGLTATFGACFALICALEIRFPYYFLQDDGLEYFLPSYIHNWRSLISGHFPLYNFHTFGGIPHYSMGQPGSLYAPQYLALLLSRGMFGHFFAAIDILAIFHLLVAAAATYLLLRHWHIGTMAAVFGGMTSLSGFSLLVGRMWPPALMLCAWFPCMLLAAERYVDCPGVKRAAVLISVRLALFYGGYPQFFILAMLFEHLFILVRHGLAKDLPTRHLIQYLTVVFPTFLLACPLLLPMIAETQRSNMRAASLPYSEFSERYLPPLKWFYGQIAAGLPLKTTTHEWTTALLYVSHIGYITSWLSWMAVPFLWNRNHRMRAVLFPAFICGVFALLWAWNILGPAIYHVPVLNRFRWPFKLVFFSGLFQCVLAAIALDGCRRRWQYFATSIFLLGWFWVYLVLPSQVWRVADHHPPLTTVWKSLLADGRYVIVSKDIVRSRPEQFIGFNYSELWGLDNLLGYEPMISAKGSPGGFGDLISDEHSGAYPSSLNQQVLERFRLWSVKYILVDPDSASASKVLLAAGWQPVTMQGGWRLWKDAEALPRIRWDEESKTPNEGITWIVGVNEIEISLHNWPGTHLTAAYTANPGLESCIETRCSKVERSSDGLVHIEVPNGTQHVRLVYRNRLFLWGIALAMATALFLPLVGLQFESARLYAAVCRPGQLHRDSDHKRSERAL